MTFPLSKTTPLFASSFGSILSELPVRRPEVHS